MAEREDGIGRSFEREIPEKNSIFLGNSLALEPKILDLSWVYVRRKSRA